MLCLSLMLGVWPGAFKFSVWCVYEWLFCSCLIQRAQRGAFEYFIPLPPPTMARHFSRCPPRMCHFILLFHSSMFLTSSIFMILSFPQIQKWRHQRLMYSLCTPPLLRRSHKMSLFGSVNVWEAALYFRLWWNLECSEVGVLWWSHASRLRWLFRAGWPVLLVDGVVEVVLAFVWERQTQSKQVSTCAGIIRELWGTRRNH